MKNTPTSFLLTALVTLAFVASNSRADIVEVSPNYTLTSPTANSTNFALLGSNAFALDTDLPHYGGQNIVQIAASSGTVNFYTTQQSVGPGNGPYSFIEPLTAGGNWSDYTNGATSSFADITGHNVFSLDTVGIYSTPTYFGFSFGDTQTYYGWLELTSSVNGSGDVQVTLLNYAYETTPNTLIAAGAVPEPSTYILFIFGLLGMVTGRKLLRGISDKAEEEANPL
jgi:hypothetical protein